MPRPNRIDTRKLSADRPALIHCYWHLAAGLWMDDIERRYLRDLTIARFRVSGFALMSFDIPSNHGHALAFCDGTKLSPTQVLEHWDERMLGAKPETPDHWRALYFSESSNQLGTVIGWVLKQFSDWLGRRRGRKGSAYECRHHEKLIKDEQREMCLRDPLGGLKTLISYIENNNAAAGIHPEPTQDEFCGLGWWTAHQEPCFGTHQVEKVAGLLLGRDETAQLLDQPQGVSLLQQRLYECYLDCIRNRNVRHRLEAWLKERGIELDSDEAAAHHRRVEQILLKAHAIAPESLIEQVGAEIICKGAKRKGSKEQRHRDFVIPGLGLSAIGGRVRR